jgi:hypothetical protein
MPQINTFMELSEPPFSILILKIVPTACHETDG